MSAKPPKRLPKINWETVRNFLRLKMKAIQLPKINWVPVVNFLRLRWKPNLSWLGSLAPGLLACAAFVVAHFWVQSSAGRAIVGDVLYVAALIGLLIELTCLVCTMGWYILDEVFIPPSERAGRLARKKADLTEVVHDLVCADLEVREKRVDGIVEELLHGDHVSTEALDRILMFVLFGFRIVLAFVFTDISLECGSFLRGNTGAVFADAAYSFQHWWTLLEMIDKSLYLNLVTIATVGFGDMAPKTFVGRVLIDIEILTSILFLTYGINVLASLVMDTTTTAWMGRKELLMDFMRSAVTQRSELLNGQDRKSQP